MSVKADTTICDADINEFIAIYKPYKYTCAQGEYLPANTLGCVVCPTGFNCPGGTYDFNPVYFQGIMFDNITTSMINNICAINFPDEIIAIYRPNIHTCMPGYFLPANVDGCTICPQNNKCVGGTYTFNETTSQGIEACSGNTPYAPTGSAICYEHILHIGDDMVYLKSTKLTSPSLNVGWDGNVYYANMTTVPTPMNSATEHVLKIEYDGTIYYVCDDTTYRE